MLDIVQNEIRASPVGGNGSYDSFSLAVCLQQQWLFVLKSEPQRS